MCLKCVSNSNFAQFLRNGTTVTDLTEKTAKMPTDRPASDAPIPADAGLPALGEDAAGETAVGEDIGEKPFNVRASAARMRQQVRLVIETMTVPQFGMGLGSLLIGLGLVLLPPPLALGHLMLGVGAIMLVLAVIWGSPAALPSTVQAEPAMERVVGIVENIERKIEHLKDTQWELSESEVRYRDLLDAQDDVILRRDAAGRLTFVNRTFSQVFGIDADDALGKPFRPVVHEGDGPEIVDFDRTDRRSYSQRLDTAQGARWYAWDEQLVAATPGQALGQTLEYQCVGRDTTDERRSRTQLAEARDAAQTASRAKSRFLAVMSHEIRTPMNGILGMTSLLEETELTPEQETYTRAVGQSAKALLGIIDEILDFSKIEAGKLELRKSPFNLDEAVQGVVELLAPRAHEKKLDIAWMIAPALPRVVVGDEIRLRQILMNLIGNAIKFTDRGGVTIRVDASSSVPNSDGAIGLEIGVEDTGIGIAPNALANIFSEFEQVDPSLARRHAGTGLGLAISRHLAEAMGGGISVHSQLGAGATFTLQLTFGRAEQSSSIGQALEPLRSEKNVLVLLESRIEAAASAATLAAFGCRVTLGRLAAAKAQVEAAAARQQSFDVLMVDAGADARHAGQILALMRTCHADMARAAAVRGIVAITSGERDSLERFRAEGFAGYLVRPMRPASLLAQAGICAGPGSATVAARMFEKPSNAARAHVTRRTWRPNVLLAEDNEIGALLACAMLDKSGCDITHARTGADAVDAFQRSVATPGAQPFDLILMDVHMPIMDGLEATRRVRVLQMAQTHAIAGADDRIPSPPIVALTANAFSEDRAQCLEAGMVDYLAKPFVKAELMAIIDKWCRPVNLGRGHGAIEEDAA
jgi:two-component system, sensor histidine kinase and response regulator